MPPIRRRCVPACKPNSVCPVRHRRDEAGEIIIYLGPPFPAASSGLPAPPSFGGPPYPTGRRRAGAALFGLAPRGVCLAASITRDAGELLPHRFTHHLCPGVPGPSAGLFSAALAVPGASRRPGPRRYRGTVPCGVRTFLPGDPGAMIRPARRSDAGASVPGHYIPRTSSGIRRPSLRWCSCRGRCRR